MMIIRILDKSSQTDFFSEYNGGMCWNIFMDADLYIVLEEKI